MLLLKVILFQKLRGVLNPSRKTSFPRRSSDWVGEIQDIFRKMGASVHHVLSEANVMADGLAKEGVLCSSITFYG